MGVSPELRTVAMSTPVRLASSQRPPDDDLSITSVGGAVETIVERPAGLDVHKAQVTACVRVPAPGGGREAARRGVRDDGRWAVGVA